MKPEFMAVQMIDLHNDTNFEKLASFADMLTAEELETDIQGLIQKQAYAEDATYADDINRMFSIATPLETKLSALYATKCASLLDDEVVARINDACQIYGIELEVPRVNKTASVFEDPAIMAAIDEFDREWVDREAEGVVELNKYAGATGYGTELDTCLAARAFYASEPEDVEAITHLAKIASSIEPEAMVGLIKEIDEALGFDSPAMQRAVGSGPNCHAYPTYLYLTDGRSGWPTNQGESFHKGYPPFQEKPEALLVHCLIPLPDPPRPMDVRQH